ncbi:unnamed protein product [Oikopleura dioica]|uniref:Uncharacterized protein n=1 Tax=Oikopleura dioica TaxID=34765 RepID=E4XDN5_OIKDI|nr:unnamed protein product [Oikopleura dioica]
MSAVTVCFSFALRVHRAVDKILHFFSTFFEIMISKHLYIVSFSSGILKLPPKFLKHISSLSRSISIEPDFFIKTSARCVVSVNTRKSIVQFFRIEHVSIFCNAESFLWFCDQMLSAERLAQEISLFECARLVN